MPAAALQCVPAVCARSVCSELLEAGVHSVVGGCPAALNVAAGTGPANASASASFRRGDDSGVMAHLRGPAVPGCAPGGARWRELG